ncbi:MAG: DUF1992 domain-containing protein [Chloroflexi bacterium]|nr:DUF1992 domain-containing protein [Chloroflexota bacterium]
MSEKPDKSEQSPDSKATRHYRMRHDWNNLIDDLIEEGREQGAFDNLSGKGKPLNLKRNLFAPELELAHGLLKHNDMKPPWITARGELQAQIETLRADIKKQWRQHEQAYRLAQDKGHQGALIINWDDHYLRWESEIAALNKQINNFNLKRPSTNLELFKISLEKELERVEAQRHLQKLQGG